MKFKRTTERTYTYKEMLNFAESMAHEPICLEDLHSHLGYSDDWKPVTEKHLIWWNELAISKRKEFAENEHWTTVKQITDHQIKMIYELKTNH